MGLGRCSGSEAAAEMADSTVDLGGGGSSVSAKNSIDSYVKPCLEVKLANLSGRRTEKWHNSTKAQHHPYYGALTTDDGQMRNSPVRRQSPVIGVAQHTSAHVTSHHSHIIIGR